MAYKIAIMAALPWEVRPFLRHLGASPRHDLNYPAWDFEVEEGRGVLTLSGMGCQAAHQAAGQLLARLRPKIFLSVGFGGALTSELTPGTVVLGQAFWHYYPQAGIMVTVPPPESPRPLAPLVRLLEDAGLRACVGNFVTTSYIIHKGRQGALPRRLLRPVLDLETSVLAEAAAEHGLAFVALRAITDGAEEEIPDFLAREMHKNYEVKPLATVKWLASDPRRVAMLFHLWRRSRQASAHLARALVLLLPALKI